MPHMRYVLDPPPCTGRDKTANKLYNTWMMHYYPNRKCIEDIVDADITADNIVLLFAEYAQLLIAHPVFHGWSNPGVGTWEEQENPDCPLVVFVLVKVG